MLRRKILHIIFMTLFFFNGHAALAQVATLYTTDETCGNSNGIINVVGSNGIPPYTYSIDGINFQTAASFTGLQAGSYTITIKDGGGSQSTSVTTLTNISGPQLAVLSTGAASCLNNDGIAQVMATGGTAAFQYSINGINFQPANQFTGLASGSYTCTVKDANGCIATVPVTIGLNNNLVITPVADKIICEGERIALAMQSNGATFIWSPTVTFDNPTLLQPTVAPTVTTKYYLNAFLGVCKALDSVMVYVNAAPFANPGLDVSICYGQSVQLNASGGISYQWTPSTYLSSATVANPVVEKPQHTMIYQLEVTDSKNCKSLQFSSVKVEVIPPTKVFAGNDTTIKINEPFQLFAKDLNNSGFTSYLWSPGIGMINNNISNPIISIDRDILYTVTATTPAGCEAKDEISIKVYKEPEIYVPTAFTPNGDGRNDILYAVPVGIREFKRFSVYNRGGQLVFSTKDASIGWDGRLKGVVRTATVFVWIAEGIDYNGTRIARKGAVTLIR